MEKGKRKYFDEPIQLKGISKYGRKVSKFVFQQSFSCGLPEKPILNLDCKELRKENLKSNEQIDCKPSIVVEPNSYSSLDGLCKQEFSCKLIKVHPSKKKSCFESQLSPKAILKKRKIEKRDKKDGNTLNILCSKVKEESLTIPKTVKQNSAVMNGRKEDKRKVKIKDKELSSSQINTQIAFKNSNAKHNVSESIGMEPKVDNQRKKHEDSSNISNKKIEVEAKTAVHSNEGSSKTSKKIKAHMKYEKDIEKLIQEKIKSEEIRLKAENDNLCKRLSELKERVEVVSEIQSYQKERLTLSKLKQNQEMLYYYLGFKDMSLIDVMVEKLTEYFGKLEEKVCEEILIEDQLTMTLMKLRRNYSIHDLAFRFRVSVADALCIVYNNIAVLHHLYYEKESQLQPFPTIESMHNNLSDHFLNFPNCRVVLECVRIGCEDPENELESDIYTSTKFDPKVFLKGIIAIIPTKQVVFASNLYECATSNADIFRDCGILDKLDHGDLIMADKSFDDVFDYLPPEIDLNIPTSINTSLSGKEIKNLNSKARALIGRTTMQHVRRFSILNHIPIFLNSIAVKVFQLCSILVNLQPTINIKNDTNFAD